jgi:hypothetical protein
MDPVNGVIESGLLHNARWTRKRHSRTFEGEAVGTVLLYLAGFRRYIEWAKGLYTEVDKDMGLSGRRKIK